ncbi:hypothetical protein [Nocardioides pantholopis]|uniref:hypothetical protein n=1 Tax=Nocardioides pantholopis TaxID=2483798 RepID=UPI0013DE78F4|nr:hypothetical protein [Nocardioides pantholopis]
MPVTQDDAGPEPTEPEPTDATEPEPTEPAGNRRRWLPALALVLAGAVCVSGVLAWWRSDHDESADVARWRDSALIEARQHVETMNSLDYREVEAGLASWAEVTTGTLHDQLTEVGAEDRALLEEQRKISTGRVVDAAVVDVDADSATVIVALEITVQDDADPTAEPVVKRNRFSVDLARVGGDWLVEDLQQVAVNLS